MMRGMRAAFMRIRLIVMLVMVMMFVRHFRHPPPLVGPHMASVP
jgi:hypothetical protein